MRELSCEEYAVQKALNTLKKYQVKVVDAETKDTLCTVPIQAANFVDALHKAWKEMRK